MHWNRTWVYLSERRGPNEYFGSVVCTDHLVYPVDFSFKAIVEELVARLISGPMQFRLILQPLTAIVLGVCDGLHDARMGTPPLLWSIVFRRGHRKLRLIMLLRRLIRPIVVAAIVDAMVQYLMFLHVRPLTALIVGTLLMGLPYLAARGLSNRIRSALRQQRGYQGSEPFHMI